MLTVHRYIRGPLPNNVYILANEAEKRCAIVDPGIGCEDLLDKIAAQGWKLELILLTHAHFDHCYGNAVFQAASGAPIAMHPDDKPVLARLQQTCINWGFEAPAPSPEPSIWLEHGMKLDVLGQEVEVRHVPGHCPGHVAFIWDGHCVSGDVLFHRGIGRWDLPGANYEDLERSIREQLFTLPDETTVYPGHMELTTIGEERRLNPYVGEAARFMPKL